MSATLEIAGSGALPVADDSTLDELQARRQERLSAAIDPRQLWGMGETYATPVHAGVRVDQAAARSLIVVDRCIRILSDALACMPARAVRHVEGVMTIVDRQPRWLTNPNPVTDWFEFAERTVESLASDGNGYIAVAARDTELFPLELWNLHPSDITVKQEDGRIWYEWGPERQRLEKIGPQNPTGDLLHIRLATGGGVRGLSPLDLHRQAIGLGLVTEKSGAQFFGKGQRLSGVIELPRELGTQGTADHMELIRDSWRAAHAGTEKEHDVGILSGGAQWRPVSISNENAQFLETRRFQVEDIARMYGIPPHMVGAVERTTSWGSGIEQQSMGFVRFTLMPWIVRLEQALGQLLPRGQTIDLDEQMLQRGDSKTEASTFRQLLEIGALSRNEIRAFYGRAPVARGDRYYVPSNLQEVTARQPVPVAPSEPVEVPAGSENGASADGD